MPIEARYVHTNIIARDWQRLAKFYEQVLGCVPKPPPRDLSGDWLEAATGIPGAHLKGIHLILPGCGADTPTLEIFQYEENIDKLPAAIQPPAANRLGLGHLAFAVPDVQAALQAVIDAGGGTLGELVSTDIPNAGRLTFVYATDPEGNIIELQHWQR